MRMHLCLVTLIWFGLSVSLAQESPKVVKLGKSGLPSLGPYWVTLSPDGKQLAFRNSNDTIGIYDPMTFKLIRNLEVLRKEVGETLTFSADGKNLVFSSSGGVTVYDLFTGNVIRSLEASKFSLGNRFVWNRDASAIVSFEDNYHFNNIPKVDFWNSKGEKFASEKVDVSGMRVQAVSGDGKIVATGAQSHKKQKETDEALEEYVTLWEHESHKPTDRIHLGKGVACYGLSLNRDGRYLIVYTNANTDCIQLWDTRKGKKIANLEGKPVSTCSFFYSLDDSKVAMQVLDGLVVVYETTTGKKLHQKKFETAGFFLTKLAGVGFLENGDILACFADQQRIQIANLNGKDQPPAQEFEGHTSQILHSFWSADGKHLFTIGGDKKILKWDAASGKLLEAVIEEAPQPGTWWQEPVFRSPDGKLVILSTAGRWQMYNLETKSNVCSFSFKNTKYYPHWETVHFSEDGKKVFLVGRAQESNTNFKIVICGAAACWSSTGEAISEHIDTSRDSGKKAFEFNYGKEKLATARIPENWPELKIGESIRDPWASPSNLIAISLGSKVTLTDKATKKVLLEGVYPVKRGVGVSISPDGKRIALPMTDRTISIVDIPAAK